MLVIMKNLGRRDFCKIISIGVGALACARPALADIPFTLTEPEAINPDLLAHARTALSLHSNRLTQRDIIGIADFSAPSRVPRFHIVDMISGETQALLVAHGKGSDLDHSGYVRQFSNVPGSEATSSGAFLLSDRYHGQHGESRRLIGLDPQNDQAEPRAIVIHSAWYVSDAIAAEQGKIGRSQGCFAFSDNDIGQVLERLGPGSMLYADKL
jgi:L,D-transpeptidase catalytic domain